MTGVIYARYSSDNQREESIEGQIRENTAFAVYPLFPSVLIPFNAINIDSILAFGEIPYRNKLRIPYIPTE